MFNYVYKLLPGDSNCIRLLHIDASRADVDPIIGSLRVADLGSGAVWSALSYTWGTLQFDHSIKIDGCHFPVTANLHTALRQFRRCRSTETQLLWVDQICINQEDLLERSDQVQLMYTIYSRADTVYISLGEGEEGQAIELIADVGKQSPEFDYRAKVAIPPDLISDGQVPKWGSFFRLLVNPYFTRTWIIQEVVSCANTCVMYNSSVSPFSSFLDTVELSARGQTERLCNSTQSRSLSSRLGGTNMLLVRDLIRTKTKWTLLQLLNQSSFLQTTDPRDKVYGLLGLAADAEYYPNPDYTKSVQDVYVEFGLSSVEKRFTDLELHLMNVTEEAIRETVTDSVKKDEMSAIYRRKAYESFPGQQCPTVNLLKHAGLHKQTLRLPSWIPDWSHRHFPASMNSFVSSIWINDDCLIIHEAAVSEPKYGVRAEQHEGGPALLLQGKLLHSIMKISDTAPGIEEQHYWASLGQWTKTCESLIREHLEIVTEHAMDLEVLTRYSKVLSVNLSSHPRTTLKASEVLKGKELRGYQLMSSGLATSEPTDPKLESAYTNIVTCMTPCRRFCITTDGKFGLVPSAAKVGDRIAMLDGIACPMILRELCSLATPCWTLVGDSFIEDHDACSPFRFTRDLPNLPFPHSFCISFDSKPPKPPGVEELVLL